MPSMQFRSHELIVDVQLGHPTTIIVVGEVTDKNRSAIEQALREVRALPGSSPVEINMVLARVADVEALSELFDAYGLRCPEIRSAE